MRKKWIECAHIIIYVNSFANILVITQSMNVEFAVGSDIGLHIIAS